MKIAHYIIEEAEEQTGIDVRSSWDQFTHWVLRAAILSGIAALACAAVAGA